MHDLQTILGNYDIAPGDTVFVHAFDPISVRGPRAYATTQQLPVSAIDEGELLAGAITISPRRAISGIQIQLDREQFEGWVEQAQQSALEQGGDGLLLGYDPIHPEARIPQGDLGISEDCVFQWSRPRGADPMFTWDEVAVVIANRDTLSATIHLTNGNSVFLHADVDWFNILS